MTTPTNPTGIGGWKVGSSGNPNGRKPGTRNTRTKEILQQLIDSGDPDPLITLSKIQADGTDPNIRVAAATALAPYLHGKLVPVAIPRFVENQLPDLPPLNSLSNAVQRAALINDAVISGTLDIATAQDLLSMIKIYMDGLDHLAIEQLQARVDLIESNVTNTPVSTQPKVEGGLPKLPGTSILMPGNGEDRSPFIEHDPPPTEAEQPWATKPSSSPGSEPKANEPTITFAHPAEWDTAHWKCR